MQFVGITGNMGSGKSTVMSLLKELGAVTLSADALASEVVKPGESAYREIVAHFGRDVLREDRTLDRRRLADIVFSDREQLARLNKITHPQVHRLRNGFLKTTYRQDPHSLVVYEIPLLFEGNLQDQFQKVIVVRIDPGVQLERLAAYRRFSAEEVKLRLNNQMHQDEKVSRADFVVDNSGSLEHLEKQTIRLHSELARLPRITLSEIL